MTPDTRKAAPESPETREKWLPVAAAAAALSISTKTLRKRMTAGAVNFRRVSLARGGAAYEVEMETVLEGSKPMFQTDFQTDGKSSKPTSHKGYISGGVLSVKSTGMEPVLEVEMESSKPTSKPMPESSKTGSISSEREAELKEEISFLRGIVESDRRDMAELRAALREALKAMPKALTSGNQSGAASGEMGQNGTDTRAPVGQVGTDSQTTATAPEAPTATAISPDVVLPNGAENGEINDLIFKVFGR
jgi:purine nucleoside permease